MKKTIYAMMAALAATVCLPEVNAREAQEILPGVTVENFAMEREGKFLNVLIDMDLQQLQVPSNRAVLLTPRLVNGNDSIELPAVGIYGRNRYYYYLRNNGGNISGDDETVFRAKDKPATIAYNNLSEFENWMDGATLMFHRSDWGCCHDLLAEYDGFLGKHNEEFFPRPLFVRPKADLQKVRSLSGSAYVDFPVDQTVIYPDYHNNTAELGKIDGTIDSVRNDKDVTITLVWLKGYASPESPYKHNTDLAVGRTAALKDHVRQLFSFDDSIFQTDYEPENWQGLRDYVEKSNIDHRDEILAMIDSDMDPDAKEAKIKKTFPKEYKFLLQNCYPYLRRTDYRIEYSIRVFYDVEEIKRVMATQPNKLSQNEFYLVAQSYEPGSPEFTEVFETAVRMFPDDEIANLNAASAAIRRDDFAAARRYLTQTGVAGVGKDDSRATIINVKGAIADFHVARMTKEHERKMILTITNDTGGTVARIPVIDYALLAKGYYEEEYGHTMTDQEFLDREDDYVLTFFLDESNNWLSTQVLIHSWMVVPQDIELN